jgi:hypothetical protein
MSYVSRFSPVRAYKDLRLFLATRQPHELGFLLLAVAITGFFIFAFAHDSYFKPEYKRNIVYVEQYRLDRTDAEIRAQQVIDQAAKDKRLAAEKAKRDKLQGQFKRLDDKLKSMGI